MAVALAIAQEHYDYMTDETPTDPATSAVAELLDQHPDFQLTARNIEDGLREPNQAHLDDFYADLQGFMQYDDCGATDFAKAKALEIARAWAEQVRNQWRVDAQQMHSDATDGYDDE